MPVAPLLIALPAAAYAGRPFFHSAVRAIKARRLNMDVPITVGVLLALGMSVVETLNHALAKVPPDQLRIHVCWGNYEGPHTHDVPFEDIQPLLYEANVGALVLSMATSASGLFPAM